MNLTKTDKNKIIGWKDRNKELKRYKDNTWRTWMHLVVGEQIDTKEKVLRLLKPFNYFSIPDKETYKKIISLLTIGGKEIDWLDEKISSNIVDIQESIKDKIKIVGSKHKEGKTLTEEENQILGVMKNCGIELSPLTELIENMVGATNEDVLKTAELLREIQLHDVNSFAEIVKSRIQKLDFFKQISKDPKTYELRGVNSIHRFLELNMWILDERYWLMHSNEQLRTIVGEEIESDPKKRPDFVCGQLGEKLIIVEIKRPSHDLVTKDLNQLENYLKIIEKHFTDYKNFEAYLVGHSISDDLLNTKKYRSTDFRIRTYTDFISDAEKRYAEFRGKK
jgi:hypothetical protein